MSPIGQPLPWSPEVRDHDSPNRSRFLESHVDLVRYVALRISSRLPATVDVDDLVNDGILGLLDALDKYDPSRRVRFRTYAESRVRGAILDGLRQKDWRPRSARKLQRELGEAIGRLSSIHHRPATEAELADAMGLDVESYRSRLSDSRSCPLLSLEDLPAGVDSVAEHDIDPPSAPLERKELIEAMAEELRCLPERERRVIELYYREELNMKEVGAVLGITESRVCQLHGQATARMRVALEARLHAVPVGAGGPTARRG